MDPPAEGGTGGSAFAMEEVTAVPRVVPELEDAHKPMPTMLRMRRCFARVAFTQNQQEGERTTATGCRPEPHRMCLHICAPLHPRTLLHLVLMLAR